MSTSVIYTCSLCAHRGEQYMYMNNNKIGERENDVSRSEQLGEQMNVLAKCSSHERP